MTVDATMLCSMTSDNTPLLDVVTSTLPRSYEMSALVSRTLLQIDILSKPVLTETSKR